MALTRGGTDKLNSTSNKMAGSQACRSGNSCRILLWRLTVLLAILSMLILAAGHLDHKATSALANLCRLGSGWSCRDTLTSPWSTFLFLPVPFWAMACYSLLFFVGPETWHVQWRHRLAVALIVLLLAASAFFLLIMERDFASPCPLCLAAHGSHFLLFLLLLTGSRKGHPRPVRAAPLQIFSAPLLVLLAAYMITAWSREAGDKERLRAALGNREIVTTVLRGDFDRFFLSHPEQFITGNQKAPFRLTIIGSLACPHCRRLLAETRDLPAGVRDQIAFYFIPYPTASACNPRIPPGKAPAPERCLLAEKTRAAQQQGAFWPWFAEINQAPGRMLRRLRTEAQDLTHWNRSMREQITAVGAVPLRAIPALLWQGRKLPASFTSLPLATLLGRLLDFEHNQGSSPTPPDEDCGC